jgi:hypothetical protein
MRTIAKAGFALAFVGAMAVGTTLPVKAQGFYLNAPGIHVHIGGHRHYYPGGPYYDYAPGGGYGTVNGCPPYYTIQGGVCKPYRGY